MKLRALLSVGVIAAIGMMGTGVAGAASTSTQYFTSMSTSFEGPGTLVASGPISATGTEVDVTNHRANFVFPQGTLVIKHYDITSKDTYDRATCVGTHSESGSYVVTRGTGAYAHATGSGHYKFLGVFQGCEHDQPPTSVSLVIQGHGPLDLG
jgi:hypothetical protein